MALTVLRRYAREAGEPAAALLGGLLQVAPSGAVQSATLEALGDLRTQQAADLAARWAEPPGQDGQEGHHGTKEARKAARRALLRLAQQGVHPSRRAELEPPAEAKRERVRRALMSAVDWEGTRLLYLLVDLPLSGAQMALAIASEAEGLLRFETVESTGRQFERYVTQERPDRELALAEIPPEYARWLVGEAARVSREQHKALPPAYHPFREALEPPEAAPEPPVHAELDAAAVRYRPDLAEQSTDLLERPEFALWIPPLDRIEPLAAEWQKAEQGPLALPPAVVTQRRNAILDRVVDLLLGPGGVEGFRRRLEDTALVLLRTDATAEARQALAAAARLDPDDPAAARRHPFVRALAQRALDLALASDGDEGNRELDDLDDLDVADDEGGLGGRGLATRPSGLILPR